MNEFVDNIQKFTLENNNFRKVLFTGPNLQLVVMSLLPGEEIGLEVHPHTDQFFRIEQGSGYVTMDGKKSDFEPEFAFVVTAGTEHNVVNSSDEVLKLYTIYSPPQHPDGTVHKTKAEAEEYEKSHN